MFSVGCGDPREQRQFRPFATDAVRFAHHILRELQSGRADDEESCHVLGQIPIFETVSGRRSPLTSCIREQVKSQNFLQSL
jgi:hypothetical protein